LLVSIIISITFQVTRRTRVIPLYRESCGVSIAFILFIGILFDVAVRSSGYTVRMVWWSVRDGLQNSWIETGVALFVAPGPCMLRSWQVSGHADVTWHCSLPHLNCRGTLGDFNLGRIVTDHQGW